MINGGGVAALVSREGDATKANYRYRISGDIREDGLRDRRRLVVLP